MTVTEYQFVEGDTQATLQVNFTDNQTGNPFPIPNGATCSLRFVSNQGSATVVTMTITNALLGQAQYTFTAGQLIAGYMQAEAFVTNTGGLVLTTLDLGNFNVRATL